ncbi:TRAP transporter permease [Sulfurospirillum diekertiae]|uniref:TRAP transporter permease n=1 Tax=Sulfurospirillum diekertiae TaxID=1854492 RepID=A0A6G9VVF2_9BACT|nr:TRAP transporter permease [Sulfurospirillum diekertiae]QIR76354.1 TRAP transporter permease [Sulfurospirillum diekertiae]QIR78984.1 TRAP transporter permease [Sulfurospirillum diekertiae]
MKTLEERLDDEKLISEFEGHRDFEKGSWHYWLIAAIAFSWSLFQLYMVIEPGNSAHARAIHLAFGLALAFSMHAMSKSPKLQLTITWYDFGIMIVGITAVLYQWYAYKDLAMRSGAWTQTDIIVGVTTILVVLEASRRVMGLPLMVVAMVFLAYDYFGPYLPDMIAHKGASLNKIVGQMVLTTEGIFGVPLGVSASFVFLFVLFGALLDRAGAGEYFIKLAYTILGRYDGGPAKAAVAASGMFGMISGSSIANTVTVGTFTIPLMKRLGFSSHKAAAVETAASVNGQLMPPIMGAAAFIMAEFLGLDYTDIVFAAFIPAFTCYIALFYIVHLEAKKNGLKGEDPNILGRVWPIFIHGIHYLIPIFFLIYTLVVLRQSAQSAAFSAIMFLMIIMLVQKPLKALIHQEKVTLSLFVEGLADIGHGMVNGGKNMVSVAIATAVAGIIVGSVTLTGIGLVLAEVIDNLANGYILGVLFLTAFVSLVLGMGLPTTANYIVMAALTAPIIMDLAGSNGYLIPALAAHMFVFYFGILADDTPPVGMAAYAAAAVAKSDPIITGIQAFIYDIRTGILPFMFFFNNELLLIGGVDANDPNDPSKWIWITNPFEIALIFGGAIFGMFAFTSATQSFILTKINNIERILLIVVIPFLMLPKLMAAKLGLPSYYFAYVIGFTLYGLIYFGQRVKYKKQQLALA